MTKTIIELLPTNNTQPKQIPSKPIVFKKWLEDNSVSMKDVCVLSPSAWNNVILLRRGKEMDTMYAFDDDAPTLGRVYMGHWNDGVKE